MWDEIASAVKEIVRNVLNDLDAPTLDEFINRWEAMRLMVEMWLCGTREPVFLPGTEPRTTFEQHPELGYFDLIARGYVAVWP